MRNYIPIFIFAALIAGCAPVPNVSLDKTNYQVIETIALLQVSESKFFQIRDFSGTAALGGVVGGIIQGSIDSSRTNEFLEAVNSRQVKFSNIMVESLHREAKKAGFQILYQQNEVPKLASDGKSDDYSHIKVRASGSG